LIAKHVTGFAREELRKAKGQRVARIRFQESGFPAVFGELKKSVSTAVMVEVLRRRRHADGDRQRAEEPGVSERCLRLCRHGL
jgi:hypothetical protein